MSLRKNFLKKKQRYKFCSCCGLQKYSNFSKADTNSPFLVFKKFKTSWICQECSSNPPSLTTLPQKIKANPKLLRYLEKNFEDAAAMNQNSKRRIVKVPEERLTKVSVKQKNRIKRAIERKTDEWLAVEANLAAVTLEYSDNTFTKIGDDNFNERSVRYLKNHTSENIFKLFVKFHNANIGNV